LPIPLAAADRIILIDNVDRKMVRSPRLSMALSKEATIKWRILGETREQTILNRSVFIATGNHLIISGDLPRRSLHLSCLLGGKDHSCQRLSSPQGKMPFSG
jgi:hypothetical protein